MQSYSFKEKIAVARNIKGLIAKLQKACNEKYDAHLLYNKTQVYSDKAHKPVTFLCIRQATIDPKTGKKVNVELFNTTTELYILLFLRDYWYELNGWEIPESIKGWEEEKKRYQQRKEKGITPPDVP